MVIHFHNQEVLFLNNGQILYIPSSGVFNIPENALVFYEVIRVIHGIPLFMNEHLERMRRSVLKSGIALDTDSLQNSLVEFIKRNEVPERNLRISLYCKPDHHGDYNYLAYFIESHYPSKESYMRGVKTDLAPLQRKNPNVKLENPTLRESADSAILMSQIHEVLLVNNAGFITEGSRSNFFAIKNQTIITPPSQDVLEGVTRKKVIEVAKQNGISVEERVIHTSELDQIHGAFLTGTSPRVLPISQIGQRTYVIPLLTQQILTYYDQAAEKDLKQTREKYF